MTDRDTTKESFSVAKRAKSFVHAGRGVALFFKTTHNAWVHAVIFVITIALGVALHIDRVEWMLLVFAGGVVFAAEAFNTAIEVDMDLTSPEFHPAARDTKDIAAGAVLIAAVAALLIGMLIFVPHLIQHI